MLFHNQGLHPISAKLFLIFFTKSLLSGLKPDSDDTANPSLKAGVNGYASYQGFSPDGTATPLWHYNFRGFGFATRTPCFILLISPSLARCAIIPIKPRVQVANLIIIIEVTSGRAPPNGFRVYSKHDTFNR